MVIRPGMGKKKLVLASRRRELNVILKNIRIASPTELHLQKKLSQTGIFHVFIILSTTLAGRSLANIKDF